MSAARSAAAIAVCAAVDGALGLAFLAGTGPSPVAVLGGHLAVSVVAGVALLGAKPAFTRATAWQLASCGMLVAAAVPVLGAPGMLAAFLFGLTAPREESRESWVIFDLEKDVAERQRHPLRTRRGQASAPEIRATLRRRTEANAGRRFKAVLAIQKLPLRVGVPLLKIAQSDPSDEIRLYAFSRLERMRDDLETRVKDVTRSLETATEGEAARLHLRLAQSYWELGYLGLAEGAVLAHALKNAHLHAATACELSPMHGPAEFFLGRVLLHLREPERATTAFERAIRAGYPRVKILPWLAECAFYQRDYGTVTQLLGELESLSPENVFFRPVSELWADRGTHPSPPPRGSRASLRIGSERRLGRTLPRVST